MNRINSTISEFFPALIAQMASMRAEIERNPRDWHLSLQDVIDQGAFLRLEFGFGAGGVVDARLEVVEPRQPVPGVIFQASGGPHG